MSIFQPVHRGMLLWCLLGHLGGVKESNETIIKFPYSNIHGSRLRLTVVRRARSRPIWMNGNRSDSIHRMVMGFCACVPWRQMGKSLKFISPIKILQPRKSSVDFHRLTAWFRWHFVSVGWRRFRIFDGRRPFHRTGCASMTERWQINIPKSRWQKDWWGPG